MALRISATTFSYFMTRASITEHLKTIARVGRGGTLSTHHVSQRCTAEGLGHEGVKAHHLRIMLFVSAMLEKMLMLSKSLQTPSIYYKANVPELSVLAIKVKSHMSAAEGLKEEGRWYGRSHCPHATCALRSMCRC